MNKEPVRFKDIDQNPDLHVVVYSLRMRSVNLGYTRWVAKIKNDAFYCWSSGYFGTEYDLVLKHGSYKDESFSVALKDVVDFERSDDSKKIVRCEGFATLSFPWMNLKYGFEPWREYPRWDDTKPPEFEVLLEKNLVPKMGGRMSLAGFRVYPQRCETTANEIRKFVEQYVFPMPPIEDCLKLRLDFSIKMAVERGEWKNVARFYRRRAEQILERGDEKSIRNAADGLLMRADILERRALRLELLKNKHVRKRRSKHDVNFFSMVNAMGVIANTQK